jgi:glycosyltransferase involved in cell wall biosynthesis
MAWRLARRGHEVVSYSTLPDDVPSGAEWRGTVWKRLEDVDFAEPGIWVLYRCPEKLDEFDAARTDQPKWLICQDWDYQTWTPERVAKCDRIVPMCRAHETWLLKRHPEFANKTWVTRNGIKPELIEEVESNGVPVRNPHRIMFASSPDRGLANALRIFKRVKEYVPDAEFHATYGFNNIDKLIAQGVTRFQKYKDECMKLVEETGAVFHGRLSQRELYREWFKTGILLYPTNFWETGWITGLEAQAMGAIPVYSPIWAQGENTRHGYAVPGNPDDPLTQARFVQAVAGLMQNPQVQEQIRGPMMADVRANWSWEQFVWQKPGENWEQAGEEDLCQSREKNTAECAAAV